MINISIELMHWMWSYFRLLNTLSSWSNQKLVGICVWMHWQLSHTTGKWPAVYHIWISC